MIDKNDLFMENALKQAATGLRHNEVPVGAVIVNSDGIIIARAYNKIETLQSQTAHAEILAIKKASKKIGDWRLNGCWIYVTLEPCLMCMGLIMLSRLEGVIFAATSTLFGCERFNGATLPLYAKHLKIEGGVKAKESIALLQSFFKSVRKKRKEASHERKS
jgi:tRNA(adenine34) deaminase